VLARAAARRVDPVTQRVYQIDEEEIEAEVVGRLLRRQEDSPAVLLERFETFRKLCDILRRCWGRRVISVATAGKATEEVLQEALVGLHVGVQALEDDLKQRTEPRRLKALRKAQLEEEHKDEAASKIQALQRGKASRQAQKRRQEAAMRIQSHERGHRARRELGRCREEMKAEATLRHMQRRAEAAERRVQELERQLANVSEEERLVAEAKARGAPAAVDGGEWHSVEDPESGELYWYHSSTLKRVWDSEMTAATRIQAVKRGLAGRQEAKQRRRQRDAAMSIQRVQRGKTARQDVSRKKGQVDAAIRIQALQRGRADRARVAGHKVAKSFAGETEQVLSDAESECGEYNGMDTDVSNTERTQTETSPPPAGSDEESEYGEYDGIDSEDAAEEDPEVLQQQVGKESNQSQQGGKSNCAMEQKPDSAEMPAGGSMDGTPSLQYEQAESKRECQENAEHDSSDSILAPKGQ